MSYFSEFVKTVSVGMTIALRTLLWFVGAAIVAVTLLFATAWMNTQMAGPEFPTENILQNVK